MTRRLRCLFLVSAWMLQGPSWAGNALVVVPQASEVDITTDFVGTDLKAMGAMDGPGDLIIKVVGPRQEATLSREVKTPTAAPDISGPSADMRTPEAGNAV